MQLLIRRTPALIALWLLAIAASSAAGNPAAKLCEGFVAASVDQKAARLADFYQAIVTEPMVEPPFHLGCVAGAIAKLEPLVANYCSKRAQRGHGILVGELQAIQFEFFSVAFDCQDEAQRPFFERLEAPIYCRDIEAYLRDSLPLLAMTKSPSQIDCLRRAIPEVADRLRASCDSEPIPRPTAFRYWDALSAACPEPGADP